MFIILVLLGVAFCYTPEICGSGQAECTYTTIPPCTVCCVENARDLHLCVAGRKDENENYNYEDVQTVYIKGGLVDFTTVPGEMQKGVDFNGRRGISGSPITILPFPEEYVHLSGLKHCFIDSQSSGINHFQIGHPEGCGRIECVSEYGFELGCNEPSCDPTKGFHDISFDYVNFRTTKAGGRISFHGQEGQSEFVPVIGLITFRNCEFKSEDTFDGIMLQYLKGDTTDYFVSSVVTFEACSFDILGCLLDLSFNSFVEVDFFRNDILAGNYDHRGLLSYNPEINGVVVMENNVIQTTVVINDVNNSAVLVRVDGNDESDGPEVLVYNNLFICNNDVTTTPDILFHIGRVTNFEMYNNIVYNCPARLHVSTYGPCFGIDDNGCTIASNFANLDKFAVHHDGSYGIHHFTNGESVVNQAITFVDQSVERPKNFMFEEDVFGSDVHVPMLDINGVIRHHTKCPLKAGPFANCANEVEECYFGWEGELCEINVDDPISGTFTRHNFWEFFLTNEDRRSDNILSDPIPRRIPPGDTKSMRSICANEYWGLMLDTDYKLWTWGEEIENEYIVDTDSQDFILIDTSNWVGVPKKIICTHTSLFVLTHENVMYSMGKAEHAEIAGGGTQSSFTLNLENVYDVHASYHTLYVQMQTKSGVDDKYDILVIGFNYNGCFGANFEDPHSGYYSYRYSRVVTTSFPANVYAKIHPMEHGVAFQFPDGSTYYAGKDHPSLKSDTPIPVRIDFSNLLDSQITQDEHIHFIDRLYGGCMYLVSDYNRIYVSGSPECNERGYGVLSNGAYRVPFELSPAQYGDFHNSVETIFHFTCGYMCYLSTREDVYVFGENRHGVGLGAECGDDKNCDSLTKVSQSVRYVYPGRGNTQPNSEQSLDVKYDVVAVEKGGDLFLRDEAVYEFPPELLFRESGMTHDIFHVKIRKPEVFGEMDSTLTFVNGFSNISVSDVCNYPKVAESKWRVWNEVEEEDSYQYYELFLPWGEHRDACAWQYESSDSFDIYHNRLVFHSNYYLGVNEAAESTRVEEVVFDFQIRFPKNLLTVDITVQNVPVEEMYDAYIVDKVFDRATRRGKIVIVTVTKTPNYLNNTRLGDLTPNDPVYVTDVLIREEAHLRECTDRNCRQTFRIDFTVADDYRVCHVPDTKIPIHWLTICDVENFPGHVDCIDPSAAVTFTVDLSIDNLCGGEMVEDIVTSFEIAVYSDWTYEEEIDTDERVFLVGDWVYVKTVVASEKVTIASTEVSSIELNSDHHRRELYLDGKNTGNGDICDLQIDDLGIATEVGFHFKIHNEVLNLEPSEKGDFQVAVQLSVMYEGNMVPVERRKRRQGEAGKLEFRNMYMSKVIEIIIERAQLANANFVPYIIAAVIVFLIGICITVMIIGVVFVWQKSRKPKPYQGTEFVSKVV